MQTDVKIKDADVRRLLAQIEQRVGHLRPAMSLIGEIVQESIQRNFEVGGRPRWKRLSRATIAQRKRLGKWPGPILMRFGVAGGLMGSIHYRPENDRVIISANKKYAAVHQFGAKKGSFGEFSVQVRTHTRKAKSGKTVHVRAHTRRVKLPWGNIPARPFMLVQKEDWREMRDAMTRFITGGVK